MHIILQKAINKDKIKKKKNNVEDTDEELDFHNPIAFNALIW